MDVSDDLLANSDADYEDNGDETYRTESKHNNDLVVAGKVDIDHGLAESLERLEGLYVKLLLALRLVVKIAFARHSDVLEAGTEVQVLFSCLSFFLLCIILSLRSAFLFLTDN